MVRALFLITCMLLGMAAELAMAEQLPTSDQSSPVYDGAFQEAFSKLGFDLIKPE